MNHKTAKALTVTLLLLLALSVLVTSIVLIRRRQRERAEALSAVAGGLIGIRPPATDSQTPSYGTASAIELLRSGIGFHLFFFSDSLFNIRTADTATLVSRDLEGDYGISVGASLKVDYELHASPTEQKRIFLDAVAAGQVDAFATRLYVLSYGDPAVSRRIAERGQDKDGDGKGDLLYSETGTLAGDLEDLLDALRGISPHASFLLIIQGEESDENAAAMLALAEEEGCLVLDTRPLFAEAKQQNPDILYHTEAGLPTQRGRDLYRPAIREAIAAAVAKTED